MIIDAHVYALPPRLRSPKLKVTGEDIILNAIHRHPEGPMALAMSSIDQIDISMKKSGIDKSLLVPFPWRSQKICFENSEYLYEAAKKNKKFNFLVSINPIKSNWRENLSHFFKLGAVGVKINPEWQGFKLNDKKCHDFFKYMENRKQFVMIHIDHSYKFSNTSAAHLLEIAAKFPKVKILAAHMGGLLGIYSLVDNIKKKLGSVWFDTAVSSTLTMVKLYVDVGIENKIIFGSDYPFNHNHSQSKLVKEIKKLKISSSAKTKIFYKNFLMLLSK